MEQIYNKKMNELGYGQFVCDIFLNWEDVKDEILLPDRKEGSGNGTVHVFLGAADECLKKRVPRLLQSSNRWGRSVCWSNKDYSLFCKK